PAPQATADASPAAPAAGTDFSTTNVQEAGVDEPDAVKTDGRRMYVAMNQKLYALDVSGDAPRLLGSLPLEGYGHELLLREGKLLVLSSGGFGGPMPMPGGDVAVGEPVPNSASFAPYVPRTTLMEIDADDLKVIRTLELPGSVVGGRLRGGTARIAIATQTGVEPAEGAPEFRRWMPTLEIERPGAGVTRRQSIAPCSSVRRPQVFAGLGLLTVLTIDLDRGLTPVDSDAILADASTVYASANRLYLATERWVDPETIAEDGAPAGRSTTIHGFDVSKGDSTRYVGSGNVRGYLLNQFSLSEHRGALRVATTEDPPWFPGVGTDGTTESFVTVLDEIDGRLVQVGRVGGLGKGERIYAVRFVEDVGFVVTFRQTDPLYTLDLGDKTAPRVVGELKIPGFSSYLHPIGDGLMIGVGQDADAGGRTRGAQVSLFDVNDLSDPRRLHQKLLGEYASTQAEHDHHAFLWWPATKLLVLPLSVYDYRSNGDSSFFGAVGMRVDRGAGFADVGRTEHPKPSEDYYYSSPIQRALVANGKLFTISYFGVQAGRLDTLAGTAWVPFES
ncbi:MAG TPA: beta-propeller domain-containing protein, partial [Solirubrobacteraceae bacterium]|nr:beta-propeller domain-containing protein [Solirubrobacteraceae bacterium]